MEETGIRIGNHLSSSRGYAAMGRAAVKLGADTFAFFTRNPRGGAAKAVVPEDVRKFLDIAEKEHFGKLVAHAPYTMNLCAAREEVRSFSLEMIGDDLRRMEYIPGNYYNFHPGSHVGQGTKAGIAGIADALNKVLKKEQTTTVLLETMAGKGSEVGGNFQELRDILDLAACRDRHQRKLQVAARPQRRAEVVVGQRIPLDIYHGRLGAEIPQLDNRSVVRDDGSPLLRTAAGSHNRSRRSKTDNHLLHSKTFLAVIRIVTPFKHISCP